MSAGAARKTWVTVTLVWLAAVVLLVATSLLPPDAKPLLADTDDAMRMATAADLLDGQPWQDTVVHRDNAPFGAPLHWSRLIDAPLAGLIALFRPTGHPDLAALVWPLLLLLPLLALSELWGRRIAGPGQTAAALVLPLLSMPLLAEFSPGRVDHHNVQILLLAGLSLALTDSHRHRASAIAAGFLAAASIAIGLETLPFVVLSIALVALLWAFDPLTWKSAAVWFALPLFAGTAALAALALPADQFGVAACDAISIVYVLATGLACLVLLALAALSEALKTLPTRLLVLATLGALSLGVLTLFYPQCLAGPYAQLDPRMAALFSEIGEARPLWLFFEDNPASATGAILPPAVALLVAPWRLRRTRGDERLAWLVLLAFLAVATLMTIVQIRGARLAAFFAVPAGVWAISAARERYLAKGGLQGAGLLVATWLVFASVIHNVVVIGLDQWLPKPAVAGASEFTVARLTCFEPEVFATLAALDPGIAVAPPELGPHILHYTRHAVVSAGFHRNVEGTLDARAFFRGNEDEARRIAAERNIRYVVGCPTVPLKEKWSWLKPVSPKDGKLEILEVQTP